LYPLSNYTYTSIATNTTNVNNAQSTANWSSNNLYNKNTGGAINGNMSV
jgi:hypothetical protein